MRSFAFIAGAALLAGTASAVQCKDEVTPCENYGLCVDVLAEDYYCDCKFDYSPTPGTTDNCAVAPDSVFGRNDTTEFVPDPSNVTPGRGAATSSVVVSNFTTADCSFDATAFRKAIANTMNAPFITWNTISLTRVLVSDCADVTEAIAAPATGAGRRLLASDHVLTVRMYVNADNDDIIATPFLNEASLLTNLKAEDATAYAGAAIDSAEVSAPIYAAADVKDCELGERTTDECNNNCYRYYTYEVLDATTAYGGSCDSEGYEKCGNDCFTPDESFAIAFTVIIFLLVCAYVAWIVWGKMEVKKMEKLEEEKDIEEQKKELKQLRKERREQRNAPVAEEAGQKALLAPAGEDQEEVQHQEQVKLVEEDNAAAAKHGDEYSRVADVDDAASPQADAAAPKGGEWEV